MMRRAALLLVLLLLFLPGCSRTPEIAPLAGDAVILAFGDSLTHGTGARNGESYPARLQALIGRRVINAGIPGEVTTDGLKRLPALLDQYQPDLLLLCHGGNDILRRHSQKQIIANLKTMIEMAQAHRIPVVLIAVPQLGLLLDPAPYYADLAKEYDIPCAEEILSDILSERDLKSDSIHPNASGYEKLAQRLSALLQESGAI